MKKLAILAVLAAAAVAASATEISVSGLRDSTQNSVTGYSIAVAQPVASGLTLKGKFENTKGVAGTDVDDYSISAAYNVAKVGAVTLTGLTSVGYADIHSTNAKGTYVQLGAKASVPVSLVKNLSTSVAIVRQFNSNDLRSTDRTEATVGLGYAVTKNIAVNASATFYNGVPGSKTMLGVSYTF